ncbi:hypothetical protein COV18_00865 [Candidatus Woesearchaeota archaeon CG10_big_fil_rev_8_21_14_0_10_37_12]|nr:MAG: hypothetical protein COV18_00865 [Candidatus Woesearchaeota archaeon CG10_big_fil_rev_8_21_14_0_10_37_12]
MEPWNAHSEKVNKQRADFEKAKALLKMTALREQRTHLTPLPQFTTLLAEEYYEIIKELITAIMSVDGWKTTSHELLIGYIAKFYPEFTNSELALLDQLREMRNDIAYRGVMINPEYLERNQDNIHAVIQKLKQVLNMRMTGQR